MFYRLEMSADGKEWEGIFSFLYPDQRRYIGRTLKEPKWYQKNPGVNSRCWFTQKGYEKFGGILEEMAEEMMDQNPVYQFRILEKEKLENVVMQGKIQCIELIK